MARSRAEAERAAWRRWLRGAGPPPGEPEPAPSPPDHRAGDTDAGRRGEGVAADGRAAVEAWLRAGRREGGGPPPTP
jgi:hypothetical protein